MRILYKISLTLFLFSFTFQAVAQSGFNIDWLDEYFHTQTSGFSNEGSKIAVDGAGNAYVLANVTSDIDVNGNITGNIYSYVVLNKYNPSGAKIGTLLINVNQHVVDGFSFKSGFGLSLDPLGNVYVGYNIYDNVSDYDVILAKYTSNLNLTWQYRFNPISPDYGKDMVVTPNGEIYAVVSKVSSNGTSRYVLIKATGNGVTANALYNFSPADVINSIINEASTNIYVTGYRVVSGDKRIITASLTSTGTLRWFRQDNTDMQIGDDIGNHITFGADGFVYVTGSVTGTVQHGIDVVTLRINAVNGKLMWKNIIHQAITDGGIKVACVQTNVLYVAWNSGNSVYIDLISTDLGQMLRRVSYTPTPATAHVSKNGASISDMKVSANKIIYLTGSILATTSGNQMFSSSYLLKVDFSGRANNPIAGELISSGTLASSNQTIALALDENYKKVFLLQDQFNDYYSHQDEISMIISLDTQNRFRLSDSSPDNNGLLTDPQILMETLGTGINLVSNFEIEKIELFDMNGKRIIVSVGTSNMLFQMNINISELNSGVYIARVFGTSGEVVNQKFVLE